MAVYGVGEVEKEAGAFAATLAPREGKATLVTLSGDLGAGKTTFVRALLRSFGVDEGVISPTFVIEKIYPIRDASRSNGASEPRSRHFERVIHIDAYRLKGAHELEVLGWRGLVADPRNLVLLEWPERVHEAMPSDALRITLRYSGTDEREIIYEKN
jgi:tRNA A37 threonylcarbamoyladenosine biosynthesis protein TsaE